MRKNLASVLFACLCVLTSCLEVDATEIHVVADRAQDRLDILIVSRGLSSSSKDVAKDFADLLLCRDEGAVPVPGFGVWRAGEGDKPLTPPEQELLRHLEFETGGFFLDEQKHLCFYQFVRVQGVQQFAAAVDAQVRAKWVERPAPGDPRTQALFAKAAKEGVPMLRIDGAAFAFTMPQSTSDYRTERAALFRQIGRDAEEDRGMLVFCRENDLALVRHAEATEYVVGALGSERNDFVYRGKEYQDNLLQALTAAEPRPPAVTAAQIEREFKAFHGRAARPPAPFAARKASLPK